MAMAYAVEATRRTVRDAAQRTPSAVAPEPTVILHGTPGGSGRFEGRARVVRTAAELRRIQPGDVLVTRCATPEFAAALPLIGALVTDEGGALCSLATLAREHGVPVVSGTGQATTEIADGSLVFVDGERGLVATVTPALAALRWLPRELRPR